MLYTLNNGILLSSTICCIFPGSILLPSFFTFFFPSLLPLPSLPSTMTKLNYPESLTCCTFPSGIPWTFLLHLLSIPFTLRLLSLLPFSFAFLACIVTFCGVVLTDGTDLTCPPFGDYDGLCLFCFILTTLGLWMKTRSSFNLQLSNWTNFHHWKFILCKFCFSQLFSGEVFMAQKETSQKKPFHSLTLDAWD